MREMMGWRVVRSPVAPMPPGQGTEHSFLRSHPPYPGHTPWHQPVVVVSFGLNCTTTQRC